MAVVVIDELAPKNDAFDYVLDEKYVRSGTASDIATEVTTNSHTLLAGERILNIRLATIGEECFISVPTALITAAQINVQIVDADGLSSTYTIWIQPVTGTINKETEAGININGGVARVRSISTTELQVV